MIHSGEMKEAEGTLYVNEDDLVDRCTTLVEDSDGNLHLLNWAEEMAPEISGQLVAKRA